MSLDSILQFTALREEAKIGLIQILEELRGRKCLVLDPTIPLSLLNIAVCNSREKESSKTDSKKSKEIDGLKFLKEHGVQFFREILDEQGIFKELGDFSLDSGSGGRDVPDNIVYLVRPTLSLMSFIAQQIKAAVRMGVKSQFHICFVPNHSTICVHLLEEHIGNKNIWDRISFGEYNLTLIPLDSDLLSLEMDSVFKQCYVDGDLSSLAIIAQSLHSLQNHFGMIPNIRSKGLGAKKVLQRLFRLRKQQQQQQQQEGVVNDDDDDDVHIDTLVLLDREVDLVSPLVTPLTYEGLVDDILNIQNSHIRIETSLLGDETAAANALPTLNLQGLLHIDELGNVNPNPNPNPPLPTVPITPTDGLGLGSSSMSCLELTTMSDSVYADVRDLSIEKLGSYMQDKAIRIREKYTSFRDNKDLSITEIHDFVKKIPMLTQEFKSLTRHINIAAILKLTTDTKEFRDQWQGEREMLEGEQFLDGIEELIYSDVQQSHLFKVLRLLCIQANTSGGIRSARFESIRRLLVQTYGLQNSSTLHNLERCGLLRRKDSVLVDTSSPVWLSLRKQLRLISESDHIDQQQDLSYVSAGYAPLSCRIVETLAVHGNNSWSHVIETLKLLPGPLLELKQMQHAEELGEAIVRQANDNTSSSSSSHVQTSSSTSSTSSFATTNLFGIGIMSNQTTSKPVSSSSSVSVSIEKEKEKQTKTTTKTKKVMLVFVIGGISYLEIAALRFLSRSESFPYRIVVASSKIVNGTSFLKSIV